MSYIQGAAGATVHWLNHEWLAPLGPGKCFFGRFLLRLSRIKRPQVMFMVKLSPTAFKFDIAPLVQYLGNPLY